MAAFPPDLLCTYTGTGWLGCNVTPTTDVYTWIDTGCYSEPPPPQKKNPFLLAGYLPDIIISVGRPQKKKESFKKCSQVVISRVGTIET